MYIALMSQKWSGEFLEEAKFETINSQLEMCNYLPPHFHKCHCHITYRLLMFTVVVFTIRVLLC